MEFGKNSAASRNLFADLLLTVPSNDDDCDSTAADEQLSRAFFGSSWKESSPIVVDLTSDGREDEDDEGAHHFPELEIDVKPLINVESHLDIFHDSSNDFAETTADKEDIIPGILGKISKEFSNISSAECLKKCQIDADVYSEDTYLRSSYLTVNPVDKIATDMNEGVNIGCSSFQSPPCLKNDKYSPVEKSLLFETPNLPTFHSPRKSLRFDRKAKLLALDKTITDDSYLESELIVRLEKFSTSRSSIPDTILSVNEEDDPYLMQLLKSFESVMHCKSDEGLESVNDRSVSHDVFARLETAVSDFHAEPSLMLHNSVNIGSSPKDYDENFYDTKLAIRLPRKLVKGLKPPTLSIETDADEYTEKCPSRITMEHPKQKYIGKVYTKASLRRENNSLPKTTSDNPSFDPSLYKVKASTISETDSFQEATLRPIKVLISKLPVENEFLLDSAHLSSSTSRTDNFLSVPSSSSNKRIKLSNISDKLTATRAVARKRTSKFSGTRVVPRLIREIENTLGYIADDSRNKESRESKALNVVIERISYKECKSSRKSDLNSLDSSNDTASTCSTIELKQKLHHTECKGNNVSEVIDTIVGEFTHQIKCKKRGRKRKSNSEFSDSTSVSTTDQHGNRIRQRKKRKRLLSENEDDPHKLSIDTDSVGASKKVKVIHRHKRTPLVASDIPKKDGCLMRRGKCPTSSAAQQIRQKYAHARRQFIGPTGLHPKVLKCLEMKKEDSSFTPMHLSASLGHQASLEHCLSNMPHMIHERDGYGRTPLHWSSLHNHIGISKLLLEVGADPNAASLDDGRRPLHEVLMNGGSLAMVRLLVEAGSDPDFPLYSGKSTTSLTKDFEIIDYLKSLKCVQASEARDYEFDLRQSRLPTVFTLRSSTACGKCKNYVLAKDIAKALSLSYGTFVNRYSARITLISSNFIDLRQRFVSDANTQSDGLGESFEAIVGNDCDFLLVEYDDRVRDLLHANRFSVTKEEADNEWVLLSKLNSLVPFDYVEIPVVSSPVVSVASDTESVGSSLPSTISYDKNNSELSRPKQASPIRCNSFSDASHNKKKCDIQSSAIKMLPPDSRYARKRKELQICLASEENDNLSNTSTENDFVEQDDGDESADDVHLVDTKTYCAVSNSPSKVAPFSYAPRPSSDHNYACHINFAPPLKILDRLEQGCKHILLLVIQWKNEISLIVQRINILMDRESLPSSSSQALIENLFQRIKSIVTKRIETYKRHQQKMKHLINCEREITTDNGNACRSFIWKEFVQYILTDHLVILDGYFISASKFLNILTFCVPTLVSPRHIDRLRQQLRLVESYFIQDSQIITESESMLLREIKRLPRLLSDVIWDNEEDNSPGMFLDSSVPASQVNPTTEIEQVSYSITNGLKEVTDSNVRSLSSESSTQSKHDPIKSIQCPVHIPISTESIPETLVPNSIPKLAVQDPVQDRIQDVNPKLTNGIQDSTAPHSKDCVSCDFCKRLKQVESSCNAVLQFTINGQKRRNADIPPLVIVPSDFPSSPKIIRIKQDKKKIANLCGQEVMIDATHPSCLPGTSTSTIDLTSDSD